MSTRATILIKSEKQNEQVRIYHHWDGYPEGVGADLKHYLKEVGFFDAKIKGYPYFNAYLIANDLIKGKCGIIDGKPDMGYELTSCQHGDEEYAYLIDCDNKTLKCYKVGWDEFEWKEENVVEIPD